ncbi:MAG: type II toxin-antitoxin system VapC family toxin [Deltaproteobacteria bacterium]|nr:type II toxin-antitoxin system VapC family toxin [Deltaproteobacteria bacterium]
MPPSSFVVDSSVVVKWFVKDEPDDSPAQRILQIFRKGDSQFIIPDLLFYEVGNVFLKKWPRDLEKIQRGFLALWRLPWFLIPLRQSLLARSLELAAQYQLTFYDALFVATAERSEAAFITADEKLLKRIKFFPFAHSLSSFEGDD